MINRCLTLVSKYNSVWVVYSLYSCHKCTRWSHPILTFLTCYEMDCATNVPSVQFTRSIFEKWLYLLMPFYYRYNCKHICRVWYELFLKNKLNITHCSACCFGILLQYILSFQKIALLVLCTRIPSIVLTPVMRNFEFWQIKFHLKKFCYWMGVFCIIIKVTQ